MKNIQSIDKSHNLLIELLAKVGAGDGKAGWIEHDDQGEFRRDSLSLDGELIFGFEAINAIIYDLRSENARLREDNDNLRQQLDSRCVVYCEGHRAASKAQYQD